jgi:hypothetical protein
VIVFQVDDATHMVKLIREKDAIVRESVLSALEMLSPRLRSSRSEKILSAYEKKNISIITHIWRRSEREKKKCK